MDCTLQSSNDFRICHVISECNFIAMPIFLAANVFNRMLTHQDIESNEIFLVLGVMIVLVLASFHHCVCENRLQESIAYEMSATERLTIGEKLKMCV